MKLLDVALKYISEGHNVTWRVRKDGGIIITSVDGKKFSRAGTGNKYLRQVTGVSVSKARMEQTSYNVQKFIKLKEGEKKATSKYDDPELKKLTKKAQAIWRKNKTVGEGRITIRKVRWIMKNKGRSVAQEYLERRMRYAEGYAYEENVYYWVDVLNRMGGNQYPSEFRELADILLSKKDRVREKDLQNIHGVQYAKELSLEEKLRQIREIIEKI